MGLERYQKAYNFHNQSKIVTISKKFYNKNIYKVYSCTKKIYLQTKFICSDLLEVIKSRRTLRDYNSLPIDFEDLSTILYYSNGINGYLHGDYERRFIPSAGARYPIELYILSYDCEKLESGIYHYNVKENALEYIAKPIERELFYKITNYQDIAKTASLFILFSANFENTMSKYGERGYRYIFLDAGHMAQNIVLISEALKIKNTLIGGYDDNLINDLIDLDANKESIIYICAIGK